MSGSMKSIALVSWWLALWVWSPCAQGASWPEHHAAGLRAYELGYYDEAVEQLEAALYFALEVGASGRDIGVLYENLSMSYLAEGRPEKAWQLIHQWDRMLAANSEEPWALEQKEVGNLVISLLKAKANGHAEPVPAAKNGQERQNGKEVAHTPRSAAVAPAHGVHLASYRSAADAEAAWPGYHERYAAQLNGASHVVLPVDLGDRGIYYRLVAAPFSDLARAKAVCQDLTNRGQYCAALTVEAGP